MPIIEIEADRRVATPAGCNQTAALAGMLQIARTPQSGREGLRRLPRRLGFFVVAAIVSTPLGCGSRELLPAETDPTTGSSPSTGNGDGDGPAGGSGGLGHSGPGDTGNAEAGSTSNAAAGSTGDTAASSTGDTAAGSTGDTAASSTGDTAASSTGDTAAGSTGELECEVDAWEPNDAPEAPSMLGGGGASGAWLEAFLCSGESDWYRFEVDSLMYDFYEFELDAIAAGSSLCGEPCEDPFLPDAPENTMTIEVYDAGTLVLLEAEVQPDGRVGINGSGAAYSHDLLIRVYGPSPAATFAYTLDIDMYDHSGEDECEC